MEHLSPGDRTKLLDQLKRHEGRKLDGNRLHVAYRCTAGALTIGYGHNLDANPAPGVGADSRLTEAEAEALLAADVVRVAAQVAEALSWARSLEPARYGVLINLCFNMGLGSAKTGRGLLSFKNTLPLIERGDYGAAAAGMLASKWAKQVKGRARELAEQMRTGEWQTGAPQ